MKSTLPKLEYLKKYLKITLCPCIRKTKFISTFIFSYIIIINVIVSIIVSIIVSYTSCDSVFPVTIVALG